MPRMKSSLCTVIFMPMISHSVNTPFGRVYLPFLSERVALRSNAGSLLPPSFDTATFCVGFLAVGTRTCAIHGIAAFAGMATRIVLVSMGLAFGSTNDYSWRGRLFKELYVQQCHKSSILLSSHLSSGFCLPHEGHVCQRNWNDDFFGTFKCSLGIRGGDR